MDNEQTQDLSEVETLRAQVAELQALIQSGNQTEIDNQKKIDAAVAKRTTELQKAFDKQLKAANESNAALGESLFKKEVYEAAAKKGVASGALEDVVNRARSVFIVNKGQVTSSNLDSKGQNLTIDSYLDELATSAPHLFGASSGSGATQTKPGQKISGELTSIQKISLGLKRK